LADYNRAIAIKPDYAPAYNNRGILKEQKLNDPQGALADYNRAIAIKHNYANCYSNRGELKYKRLSDRSGAIDDIKQAAELFRKRGNTEMYQKQIDLLMVIQQGN
jgi:tetratricopeptide (TPR) repeat protein